MHQRGFARLGSARIAAIAFAGVLAACSEPPVAWSEIRSGTSFVGDALAPDGMLVHDIAGKIERFGKPTGVRQVGRKVWLGSFEQTTLAVLDLP